MSSQPTHPTNQPKPHSCYSCSLPLDGDNRRSKFQACYCIDCQNQVTKSMVSYGKVRERLIELFFEQNEATNIKAVEIKVDMILPRLPRWQPTFDLKG